MTACVVVVVADGPVKSWDVILLPSYEPKCAPHIVFIVAWGPVAERQLFRLQLSSWQGLFSSSSHLFFLSFHEPENMIFFR